MAWLFNLARLTGAGALIGFSLITPEKAAADMSIATLSVTVGASRNSLDPRLSIRSRKAWKAQLPLLDPRKF